MQNIDKDYSYNEDIKNIGDTDYAEVDSMCVNHTYDCDDDEHKNNPTLESYISECKKQIVDSDYIIIGLGEEFASSAIDLFRDNANVTLLDRLLDNKNFFIVSTSEQSYLRETDLNQKRISCPLSKKDAELEEKQWNLYNKWLSASLGKRLLIIELGVAYDNPNIIKWPFERITMINNTACLYRISTRFFQFPPEIADKTVSIEYNPVDFLKELIAL